jgi:hypothetical protein
VEPDAFSQLFIGLFVAQEFNAVGVRLILEFNGGTPRKMMALPLPLGHVYDDLPWRAIVPNGTTEGLTMVDLELDQEVHWHDAVTEPPWWTVGKSLKNWWRDRAASKLKNEIFKLLASHPTLTVG